MNRFGYYKVLVTLVTMFSFDAAALAGAYPPPIPMVQTEGSIAVVEILQVVDRGVPDEDRPTVLKVQVVSLLRSVGNGIPSEFNLVRAPRVALGPKDCSGKIPGDSYLNYDVPKLGDLQIISGRMESAHRVIQIGPYYDATPANQSTMKKEIAKLSGVRSNFSAEAQRVAKEQGVRERADNERKALQSDWSKVVSDSTDIFVVEHEDPNYRIDGPWFLSQGRAKVIRRLLDSGTSAAKSTVRPAYIVGADVPSGPYIVFLRSNEAAKHWVPPTTSAAFGSLKSADLFEQLLFSYKPTSINRIGVTCTPAMEAKIKAAIGTVKGAPSRPDKSIDATFRKVAQDACGDRYNDYSPKAEANNLFAFEQLNRWLGKDNYAVSYPIRHLKDLYSKRHDKETAIKFGNMLVALQKRTDDMQIYKSWRGWHTF